MEDNTTKRIPALTLEEFHQQLVDGTYAPEVMMEREYFRGGHVKEALMVENMLPIYYPGLDPTKKNSDGSIQLNGICVATLFAWKPEAIIEAKRHLRQWPNVKLIYTNVRGNTIVFFHLGNNVKTQEEFNVEREKLESLLLKALPYAHFKIRKRAARGVMAAWDPEAILT